MKNRIQIIRKENNLSVQAFAARIGISREAVRLIENGTSNPAERTIRDICKEFGINKEWIITGKGEKYMVTQGNTSLDAMAAANNIDPVTRAIIEGLIEMQPAHRDAFLDLVNRVAVKVRNADYESAQAEAVSASIGFGSFNAARVMIADEDQPGTSEPQTI